MAKDTAHPITLAVVNSKGGVGKTTTAVAFAELLADEGPAELVDLDPQGSATRYHAAAARAGTPMAAELVAIDAPRTTARVIDTAPGYPELIRQAIAAADLVVVPTTPRTDDLDRTAVTVAEALATGTPALALLTFTTRGYASEPAAREVLDALDVPTFDASIPRREAIGWAWGEPLSWALLDPWRSALGEALDLLAELNTEGANR